MPTPCHFSLPKSRGALLSVLGVCLVSSLSSSEAQTPAVPSSPAEAAQKSAPAAAKPAAVKKPKIVSLRMEEGLRFDPPRMEALPGDVLQFELENVDPSHQPHNLVIVAPGQVQEIVKVSMDMGDTGPNKGFIPEHASVLASSKKVVDPEGKVRVLFTVPKEPGVYGYVCTVPGHGVVMYGALYVGTPMPPLAKDTNIPQLTLEKGLAGGGRRPFVQRFFLPDSGPASIAVALPGTQNYCFDAGNCRLRYVWSGPFLDGSRYWRGNGKENGELGDVPWWTSTKFPLSFGDKGAEKEPKFLGYALHDGVPEFQYRIGKHEVFQSVKSSGAGLELHFRVEGAKGKVTFLTDSTALWKCPEGVQRKDGFEVTLGKTPEFSVFLEQKDPPPTTKPAAAPVSLLSHPHNP